MPKVLYNCFIALVRKSNRALLGFAGKSVEKTEVIIKSGTPWTRSFDCSADDKIHLINYILAFTSSEPLSDHVHKKVEAILRRSKSKKCQSFI
jgi:hypothetical protein